MLWRCSTTNVAKNIVHGLECSGLGGSRHLLALETIVELLCLLVLTALLTECLDKIGILRLQFLLVDLHAWKSNQSGVQRRQDLGLAGQLLVQIGDFRISVMNDLIDLSTELVVLVCQAFSQILLVDTARHQPRF